MRPPTVLATLAGNAVLAAIYFGAARLGLHIDAVAGLATTVWPPTGIALAALVLAGRRLWPGVTLGAFLANLSAGASPLSASMIAIGNTLEAVVGSSLLGRAGFRPSLARVRDALVLITLAAGVSTLISASFGLLAIRLGGPPAASPAFVWGTWWIGDVMGDLLVAPVIFCWAWPAPRHGRGRLVEGGVLLVVLGLAACYVFTRRGDLTYPEDVLRSPYALFPLLIWAALRLGPRGATAASLVASAIAIWGTAAGRGPFVEGGRSESLFYLQTFMAVVALTVLFLGAAIGERQEAVAVREEFLSIASHELRTPLTSLQLRVQGLLIRLRKGGEVPREDLVKGLTAANRQVDRLTKLVADLLDVSRAQSGGLPLRPEEVELGELCRDVAARFSETLPGAPLQIAIEAERPVAGRWDRLRIEQVVLNLLSNAIKYGRGQPVGVRVEAADGRAVLRVSDRGIGIEERDQARIFRRFERLTTKESIAGLGLGLYITRHIVEAHGGTIRVESTPGVGSTFIVELPRD